MPQTQLRIALIAHDQMKRTLADWVWEHRERLRKHRLIATGTTGRILLKRMPDLSIEPLASGPLGGDLQIGAKIVEGEIDILLFFVDPLAPQPHDVDVKALMRIAILQGVPMALNPATAEAIIAAPYIDAPEKLKKTPVPHSVFILPHDRIIPS